MCWWCKITERLQSTWHVQTAATKRKIKCEVTTTQAYCKVINENVNLYPCGVIWNTWCKRQNDFWGAAEEKLICFPHFFLELDYVTICINKTKCQVLISDDLCFFFFGLINVLLNKGNSSIPQCETESID